MTWRPRFAFLRTGTPSRRAGTRAPSAGLTTRIQISTKQYLIKRRILCQQLISQPSQISGNGLQVHEVAEARASALSHFVLATAGLPKVGDGAQFCVNGTATEPTIVQIVHRSLRIFFPTKLQHIHNSFNNMIFK